MVRIVDLIDKEVMSVKTGKRFLFSFEKLQENNGWSEVAGFIIIDLEAIN